MNIHSFDLFRVGKAQFAKPSDSKTVASKLFHQTSLGANCDGTITPNESFVHLRTSPSCRYLGSPSDGFIVRVRSAWELEHHQECLLRDRHQQCTLRRGDLAFQAYVPDANTLTAFSTRNSLGSQVCLWGSSTVYIYICLKTVTCCKMPHRPCSLSVVFLVLCCGLLALKVSDLFGQIDACNAICLLMPGPVVSLLFAREGSWSSLVLLSRFFAPPIHGYRPTCPRLFAEWPPLEWHSQAISKLRQPRPIPLPAQLSAQTLHDVADKLRGWSSAIMSAGDQETENEVRQQVLLLTSCASRLSGQDPYAQQLGHRFKHSAHRLLAAFKASLLK